VLCPFKVSREENEQKQDANENYRKNDNKLTATLNIKYL